MNDTIISDHCFSKQNRRTPGSRLVTPGRTKEGMGPMAVLTDASGSVNTKEFSQFMGDLLNIAEDIQPESIVSVQFDTKANSHEFIEPGDELTLKRERAGGTDFRAGFDYLTDNDLMDDLDLIIVFTDGGDNHYPDEPDCSVIWATTGAFYQGDPPFGRIVQVKFD